MAASSRQSSWPRPLAAGCSCLAVQAGMAAAGDCGRGAAAAAASVSVGAGDGSSSGGGGRRRQPRALTRVGLFQAELYSHRVRMLLVRVRRKLGGSWHPGAQQRGHDARQLAVGVGPHHQVGQLVSIQQPILQPLRHAAQDAHQQRRPAGVGRGCGPQGWGEGAVLRWGRGGGPQVGARVRSSGGGGSPGGSGRAAALETPLPLRPAAIAATACQRQGVAAASALPHHTLTCRAAAGGAGACAPAAATGAPRSAPLPPP